MKRKMMSTILSLFMYHYAITEPRTMVNIYFIYLFCCSYLFHLLESECGNNKLVTECGNNEWVSECGNNEWVSECSKNK